ncbi:MAG: ScyD/ScyE family protein [Gemmatimonadota bacterium]
MRIRLHAPVALAAAALLAVGCDEAPQSPETAAEPSAASERARGGPTAQADDSYTFEGGPVFDIEAAPNGNILVPVTAAPATFPAPGEATTTIREIRTDGRGGVRDYGQVTTPTGVPVNGLASVGRGNLYAARGGQDLAVAAGMLHVTPSGERLVGDIHAFEVENDPDAFAVGDWKNPQCEWAGVFTGGPQSNPYHLAMESGNTALVGDAAGNQVLRVRNTGEIEVVAVFTPPTEDGSGSLDSEDWILHPEVTDDDDNVIEPCYAQPVPNSVAVGPDGGVYVGELTGLAEGAAFGAPLGMSRVWRIEPGTRDAVCPSAACEVVFNGFTSIIDLAFGPDGDLYVVEYDENGWLSVVVPAIPTAGGTVNRCDLDAGTCDVAEIGGETLEGLTSPAAIAFDRSGGAWLLENHLAAPTVRKLN